MGGRSHSVLGTAKRTTKSRDGSPLLRAARHFHWPRTLTGLHRTLSSLDRCPMESACVCARAHVHARVSASSISSSGSQTSISSNQYFPSRRNPSFVDSKCMKRIRKGNLKWNRDLAPNFDPRIAHSNTFLHRFFWKPCCSNSLLEKEKKRKNRYIVQDDLLCKRRLR